MAAKGTHDSFVSVLKPEMAISMQIGTISQFP